jgi:hypothetical protein
VLCTEKKEPFELLFSAEAFVSKKKKKKVPYGQNYFPTNTSINFDCRVIESSASTL